MLLSDASNYDVFVGFGHSGTGPVLPSAKHGLSTYASGCREGREELKISDSGAHQTPLLCLGRDQGITATHAASQFGHTALLQELARAGAPFESEFSRFS